ncbi:MAG TPA: GntR family transcriptional regulator [Lacunisphaera sp.]|nr:GntR family transcriptional regulator [Lacunisphaera sp.]
MLPFSIELKLGQPVTEQILFAVKKAVVTGQLRPGDKFPSTRVLSEELRINPNTAQKVVTALVAEGVLVTTPAKGSVVAEPEHPARRESMGLLAADIELLVVEARKLGLEEDDVLDAVSAQWRKLDAAGKQYSAR